MSLHRLSAGAGYRYLLRHTACGDVERAAATPLTAYYTASGYPSGRWVGRGLAGLDVGTGLPVGSVVTEEQMAALYGAGRDPLTGAALGRAYPTYQPLSERVAARVAALPADLDPNDRAALLGEIERAERARRTPGAVAGFDLTFTVPKSASVLWALGDPHVQAAVAAAHRAAVDATLDFLDRRALFTRIGARSCAQVPTNGMVAAVFDHWDSRAGDPNLHSHVVIANRVQGPDGGWRSVDSRALHHATVAASELYDDHFADALAATLPVSWSWRSRGERRSAAFELDGLDDGLLAAFSTRAAQVDAALRDAVAEFYAGHGRGPNRVEVLRLRQQITRATRPAKTPHPLRELLARWRAQATRITGTSPERLAARALIGRATPLSSGQVGDPAVARLAGHVLEQTMARRATWTTWNLHAETARACRGLRMIDTSEREALHDRVVAAALADCQRLDPPDLVAVPAAYRRRDGSSVFTRPGEVRYTHRRILDAEARLLTAGDTLGAPTVAEPVRRVSAAARPESTTGAPPVRLAGDQVDAVVAIATSGRVLDVLVGPAGTGKTTALRALRAAWETSFGRGSVVGLAPSATAAQELAAALHVPCENTAKWLHEVTGPGAQQRRDLLAELAARRPTAVAAGKVAAMRHIDAAAAALRAEQASWALRAGQLLVVDEASLAGTLDLDALTRQVLQAGAKLLLVGDHHQLTAVAAGGAFGLLADHRPGTELRSLWRFRHRWEAHATRELRCGDPAALDAYQAHDRITAGVAAAMLEAAYAGWQTDQAAGVTSILVAADSDTVAALNARAHHDRIAAGLVTGTGVPLADGHAAVGDRVLTRRNDRRLVVPGGGHVHNGALWDVVAVHPDGALTVTPATGHPDTGDPAARPVVRLPARYVAAHVELGYATTAHRAQGVTVNSGHVLGGPGMTREGLYVAMTRGRESNHVYVATDAVDPDCDHLPDPHVERGARQILEAINATSGAERSAHQTLKQRQDAAGSLAALAPIRQTLLSDADARRWARLLPDCGLTASQVRRVLDSPALGALLATLRDGETLGHSMPRVLARLAAAHPLDNTADAARDPAAVLHERVSRWLETVLPALTDIGGPPPTPLCGLPPTGAVEPDDPAAEALRQLDQLLRARVGALTATALQHRPAWLAALGPPPTDASDRETWRAAVSALAAYRDLAGATGASPLGPDTSRDDTDRRRRRLAAHTLTRAQHLSIPDRSPMP